MEDESSDDEEEDKKKDQVGIICLAPESSFSVCKFAPNCNSVARSCSSLSNVPVFLCRRTVQTTRKRILRRRNLLKIMKRKMKRRRDWEKDQERERNRRRRGAEKSPKNVLFANFHLFPCDISVQNDIAMSKHKSFTCVFDSGSC